MKTLCKISHNTYMQLNWHFLWKYKILHRHYSYRNSAIICKCLFVAIKYCAMSNSHASCCRIISSFEWSSSYNRQKITGTELFHMYIMWYYDLCIKRICETFCAKRRACWHLLMLTVVGNRLRRACWHLQMLTVVRQGTTYA